MKLTVTIPDGELETNNAGYLTHRAQREADNAVRDIYRWFAEYHAIHDDRAPEWANGYAPTGEFGARVDEVR